MIDAEGWDQPEAHKKRNSHTSSFVNNPGKHEAISSKKILFFVHCVVQFCQLANGNCNYRTNEVIILLTFEFFL